ncbi:MAG: hypothetical protein V3U84_05955, partial [Thiotrichaceae bacterium]
TTPKDVFVLTGTPPNYAYTNIGNVVTLNNAGATSYLGQDVRLYYFPFDADGVLELYFAEVRNAATTLQLTREAWPNILSSSAAGDNGDSAFSNYIPNGQFEHHNDLPDSGAITDEVTQIALGNWTFDQPSGSDAVDAVTFTRFTSPIDNPENNPRYAMNVTNTDGGSGDLFKDIRVEFNDVNEFGSAEQQYTFKFSARALSGVVDVDFILVKNYGTDGDSETRTSIQNFSINASYQSHVASFTFGDNEGKTIGPNDDDFLQLVIQLPIGTAFEAEFTNFVLLEGEFAAVNFPSTTTVQSVSQFLGGSPPTPDFGGLDLGLTLRLGVAGLEYDNSAIGNPFFKFTPILEFGELWADGAIYTTSEKSSDGIPFLRLQQKYWDAATLTSRFGTGANNLTSYSPGEGTSLSSFILVSNDAGIATPAADGAVATGFAFNLIYTATASGNDVNAWVSHADAVDGFGYIQAKDVGIVADPVDVTTGMLIATNVLVKGTSITPEEFDIVFLDGNALRNPGAPGLHWLYDTVPTNYYVWYHESNETDPAVVGRTGIRIELKNADTPERVAEKTIFALNNLQNSYINTVDASSMTAGSYFEASIPSEDFYVWYTIDEVGTDPAVINKTGIQVDLLGTDDSQVVTQKTQTAINSRKFAVPDARELLFRGASMGRNDLGLDEDQLYRFSRANVKFGGTKIGSEQLSVNRSHIHAASISENVLSSPGVNAGSIGPDFTFNAFPPPITVNETGRTNSRPPNMYVGVAIKY